MDKKVNTICSFCKTKVNKFSCDINNTGHMLAFGRLFHFSCVRQYGYNKFCMKVINSKNCKLTDNEINDNLEKASTFMDLSAKQYEEKK